MCAPGLAYNTANTAFGELRSTGKLTLIQDLELRRVPGYTSEISVPAIVPVLVRAKESRAVRENLNFLIANTDASLDLFHGHHQKSSELLERDSWSVN